MSQKFSILPLVCLPLLACGGDDNPNNKIKVPDAKVFMDGSASACAAQPMYAALGNLGAVVDHPMNGTHDEFMQLYTSVGSNDATLAILSAGGTKWPTGITGGSGSAPVSIDADDAAGLVSCDLCFFLSVGGFDMTAMTLGIKDTSDVYIATAGTMMIQQKGVINGSAGSNTNYFFASVSGLHFKHVALNETDGTVTDLDSCTTSVGSGDYGYIPDMGSASLTVRVKASDHKLSVQEKLDMVLQRRHI